MKEIIFVQFIFFISLNAFSQSAGDYLPKDPKALDLYEKSIELFDSGEFEKGLRALKESIKIEPHYRTHMELGDKYYFYLHENEKAIDQYTKAISFGIDLGTLYTRRGRIKSDEMSDFIGAIRDYNKAIQNINFEYVKGRDYSFIGSSDNVYVYRGLAKYNLGDYRGAISDFDKHFSLFKERDPYIHYVRGLAKINLGDQHSGCLDLSKAGEIGYDDAYKAIQEKC